MKDEQEELSDQEEIEKWITKYKQMEQDEEWLQNYYENNFKKNKGVQTDSSNK